MTQWATPPKKDRKGTLAPVRLPVKPFLLGKVPPQWDLRHQGQGLRDQGNRSGGGNVLPYDPDDDIKPSQSGVGRQVW